MRPPLFADLELDAAIDAAKSASKLLLVDATASWCQPCKHMDRTTWVDPQVVEAIGARALAIQIDVDAQKETATKLGIRAMPTVVAFRDGAEIDRVVGMRGPADLVAWLEALARGETSLDLARQAVKKNPTNIQGRLALARMLRDSGAFDEATTEHVWLWEHMLEQDAAAAVAKHSFFVQQLGELVAQHAPAREAFARIRDAAEPGTIDWLSLNVALKEPERTIAWFETIRDRVSGDEKLASIVEQAVIPLLIAAGRWADAGHAYANPLKTLDKVIELRKKANEGSAKLEPEQAKQVSALLGQMTASEVARLRRALSEAGRTDDLRAVEEAAAKVEPAWVAPLPK